MTTQYQNIFDKFADIQQICLVTVSSIVRDIN